MLFTYYLSEESISSALFTYYGSQESISRLLIWG